MAGRYITPRTGPRAGQKVPIGNSSPQAPGGTNPETGETETVDAAVERMAGTPSNAGRQAQSTDATNKYQ